MKVLIAEDDENSRNLLETTLTSKGYSVESTSNGLEALVLAHQHAPDLIISDILMPEMDGYALCRAVRSHDRLREIPFVFYTATYTDSKDEELAYACGASCFIVKPMEIPEFLKVIEQVLDEHKESKLPPSQPSRVSADDVEKLHVERLTAKLDKKIRELEKERETLRESEERFRDFAECAADWFWETDEKLIITFASGEYQRAVGKSLHDITSRVTSGLQIDWEEEQKRWHRLDYLIESHQAFHDYQVEWDGPDGVTKTVRISGKPTFSGRGDFVGFRGVGRDVTDASQMAREMAHLATHDSLTGLINRSEFERRLNKALESSKQYHTLFALCYLDLDQFKIVNDTVGHVAGDEMLKQVAQVLKSKIRARDTLARLGGDEFSLLLEHCPLDKAIRIAESLVISMRDYRFIWQERTFEVGVSIGVVAITPTAVDATKILTQADVACYTAKDLGRNRVHVYRPTGSNLTERHSEMYLAAELSDFLKHDKFTLYTQRVLSLSSQPQRPYFEILIRMQDRKGELVFPGSFIPAAERYGMMNTIDRWVIENGFRAYAKLFPKEETMQPILAINLSGTSLADNSLLAYVEQQLLETGTCASNVCFEITETAAITDLTQATRFIAEMKRKGCLFALDDFGSGLSSFSYLKNLPVDYLKIDGSFVKDIATDSTNLAMVAAINQVGQVMGIRTIAESVENSDIVDKLKELKVDFGQGYALGRPQPLEAFAQPELVARILKPVSE